MSISGVAHDYLTRAAVHIHLGGSKPFLIRLDDLKTTMPFDKTINHGDTA